jgi:hypothetical protein
MGMDGEDVSVLRVLVVRWRDGDIGGAVMGWLAMEEPMVRIRCSRLLLLDVWEAVDAVSQFEASKVLSILTLLKDASCRPQYFSYSRQADKWEERDGLTGAIGQSIAERLCGRRII